MVQLSHPYMTTGKTIALTRRIFIGKEMFLLFNMLSRLVVAFLPRSKHLLISWLQSPSAVILEPKKIKSLTVTLGLDWIGSYFYLSTVWMSGFIGVQFSHSVVSDSLRPHEPQHARLPCPSPTPGVYLNPCPLSRWCHPTISSSVVPFSSCPRSFPASGSFQMSQLFPSGGQSIGVSASTCGLRIYLWKEDGLCESIESISQG